MNSCTRCNAGTEQVALSIFNMEVLCPDCVAEERGAPNYEKALAIETGERYRGNREFEGIGLAPEDEQYLQRQIARRRARNTPPPAPPKLRGFPRGLAS